VTQPIEEFIADHDLAQYTLVILISPTKLGQVLRKVIDFTWSRSIPLFYVHSIGFYSQFSLQLPPLFPIVDTHPDPASTQDLRLLRPWGALSHLVHDKTKNLGSKSDHEHGHIPYVLLLLHYMEEWKGSHNGAAPKNYREKTQFRDLVEAGMRRNNAEGGEENFEEAMAAVLKSLNISAGSSGLWEIFDEDECKHPTSKVRSLLGR
jgi:amyloid beta precursor protein binding protein 1